MLRILFGKAQVMPKSLAVVPMRLAIFFSFIAFSIAVVKKGEAAMKAQDAAQGPNFLPVTKMTTEGPYATTRNPMYCCMLLLVPGSAMLADSLWMAAAMSLMPLYLDKYVIAAEEALLKKLFGYSFDTYAAEVPRWLPFVGPETLLAVLVFALVLAKASSPQARIASQLRRCKFVYFPVAARGDALRLCLMLKKIPFEDQRINPANWMALKPTTLWGSMPFLELADGTRLGQSFAILRMVGKGTGFYPEDALLACKVDELIDGLNDVASKTNGTGQGLPIAEKMAKRAAACEPGGDIYVVLQRIEACYARKGTTGPFLTGELSIADLHLFAQVGWATSGFFDGVSASCLVAFPHIQAVRKAVIAIPAVAKYYEAERAKEYMGLNVGGHPAGECYATMIESSSAAVVRK